MENLKLRGYVTPEDFEGSDAEKIQSAIKTAFDMDIRKVILTKEYIVDKTVYIYEQMHLVFDGAKIKAAGDFPIFANFGLIGKDHQFCFQEDMFFLEGRNDSIIEGNIYFYNAYRIVLESLHIFGKVTYEFCKELRIEHCTFENTDNAIVLARGNNEAIIQYNNCKTSDASIVLDAGIAVSDYCIAKEPDIHDIIIKENELNAPEYTFILEATCDSSIFNAFIQDNTVSGKTFVLGKKSGSIDPKKYRDITAIQFNKGSEASSVNSEVYNCYLS